MNPEFKRNLWLEISPSRLIIMPVVLGLITALFVVATDKLLEDKLFVAASALCAALVAGWGSFAVVASINSEVAERTWDQQRLSALTPWEMAWGKLLGSAAYAWYGGLLCALVALAVALLQPGALARCAWILTGLIATVALHAWLMASRLHTLDTRVEKSTGMVGRLFGLFLVLQLLPVIFLFIGRDSQEARDGWWWNLDWPMAMQNFVLASLLLALGLLALWRSMSKQLMLRTVPWAWVVGIVALGLIVAGYTTDSKMHAMPLLVIAITAIAATYFALFTEKNNLLVWRAVIFHWKNSSMRRFLQDVPLWVVSFVVALVFAAVYTLVSVSSGAAASFTVSSILWMALLHCLRDCGIYIFFAFRNTTRKPLGMTVLTLFILGGVLPLMFSFGSVNVARLFEPMYGLTDLTSRENSLDWTAWTAMCVHLIIVAVLVWWQWSRSPKPEQK
jgi:hypothetical protein